jgi:hypothetical protein
MSGAPPGAGRPALFVAQLHRAAAQRGKLDPVYQELSDHATSILQRLYPVWALIGPGLSDPGHIEIHSRTIYLDSDSLLGSREHIIAGRLERRAVLRCLGVALHETFHGKHTKRWAIERDIALSGSDDPGERQLAIDRKLLEEPRMEAHGVREHPAGTLRGQFIGHALQAAVTDVILPPFAEQFLASAMAGQPLTRDMCGRATVYLQARTHYGILDPTVLDGLRNVWRQVLGDPDLDALDQLFSKLIWIPDGELKSLDRAAREYRAIIGPPDPPPSKDQGTCGDQAADGSADQPAAGSLEPTPDEIRRIQAQANQREALSLLDQQHQFADCWQARAGLPEDERVLAVCADLGISPRRAHNLRRQLTLPQEVRERVAERPIGEQLSVTMANRLADMHEVAPDLTQAIAERVTSTDLHDSALRDLGAFVHRTIVEDEHTYAVRIDDGALLDAAEQIERARLQLTPTARGRARCRSSWRASPWRRRSPGGCLASRASCRSTSSAPRRRAGRGRPRRAPSRAPPPRLARRSACAMSQSLSCLSVKAVNV